MVETSNPPRWLEGTCVAATLLLYLALCQVEARHQSATIDEFHLVPQAVTLRATGDLELGIKTPPFLKRWIGLALDPGDVTLVDYRVNGHAARDGWEPWIFATNFMAKNRAGLDVLYLRARMMMLPLAAFLGLCAWAWARRLGGWRAGAVAILLFAFAPEMIAFGSIVSLDLAVTALLVGSLFFLREYLALGGSGRLFVAGGLFGLALSVKATALIVVPVLAPVLVPIGSVRGRARRLADAAAFGTAALVALHATFGFHAPLPRVDELPAVSAGLTRLHATLPGWLRLPLPAAWLQGVDLQAKDVQLGDVASYLDGEWSREGWKRYYLLAWLYKTPLALLGFVAVVLCGVVFARRAPDASAERGLPSWADATLLVGPLLIWGTVLSLTGKLNIGIRYVLPCYAFGFVALAVLASRVRARSWPGIAGGVLLGLFALSSLAAVPHHLGYFNVLGGGSGGGYRHLADSNVDWGQELKHLGGYAQAHGIERLGLAYFGHVDPEIYGLSYFVPDGKPAPGWYAISVNFLAGYSYLVFDHGRLVPVNGERFAAFRELQPVDTLGGALNIYRIEPTR